MGCHDTHDDEHGRKPQAEDEHGREPEDELPARDRRQQDGEGGRIRQQPAGDAQTEQHGEARSSLRDGLDVVRVGQTPSVAVILRAVSLRMRMRMHVVSMLRWTVRVAVMVIGSIGVGGVDVGARGICLGAAEG